MEKIDVLDSNYNKTGKTINRGEKLKDGEYRAVVHILIFSSDNKLLIQRRNEKKQSWAGLWDVTCGGQVQAGESIKEAARRELLEEMGIDIDFSNIRPSISAHFSNGIDENFIIKKDVLINELSFNDNEVVEAKYATLNEIIDLINKKQFVPYYKSALELMFDFNENKNLYKD